MTAPTLADDEQPPGPLPPTISTPDNDRSARSHQPHAASHRTRRIAGLLAIGLVVGYEVGATALNEALEEEILPTVQSLVQNTSLRSVELRGARVLGQVGMWAGMIGVAVVVEVGLRRQLARRRRRR